MQQAEQDNPNIGYSVRPMPGEIHCGDACAVWSETDRVILVLADGLGHGPEAEEAAKAAIGCVSNMLNQSCEDVFSTCDQQLRHTRGVAMALAFIDPELHQITLATVGNIRAVLLSGAKERHLGGARGIVGAGFDGLAPETLQLKFGDTLMLYTDGLDEFLPLANLLRLPLSSNEMAIKALELWAKPRDDAAFLIYQHLQRKDKESERGC
jgi:negative regulator of sigma-B (phosphoserine phosphatase)